MKIRVILILLILSALCVALFFIGKGRHNDLRDLFLSNQAIIYTINIRNFNAKDTNGNGIIEDNEQKGNFINAIERLDEIKDLGVNTLHVMPIMEVGQINALGTEGSLYAAKSFNKLNPQLKDENSDLSLEEQAKKFIHEAHKRGLYVIIDLPGCGAYDLSLTRPELFVRDDSKKVISPYNMGDVRPLDGGFEFKINRDVYNLYKSFVDNVIYLGADGIRADAASSKPSIFWAKLIDYTRTRDPQFLWLAEAYTFDAGIAREVRITHFSSLLDVGFDGYYDSFASLIEWRKAPELLNNIKFVNKVQSDYGNRKSIIGGFTTHDELSPILINGIQYSRMILWLNSTLKVNPFYVDGFQTGDDYIYKIDKSSPSYNKKHFVNHGKIDVFNFSRKPEGKYTEFKKEFKYANDFRKSVAPIITYGEYKTLKSSDIYIFSYGISYKGTTVLTIGNINFKKYNKAFVTVPGLKSNSNVKQIKGGTSTKIKDGGFDVKLSPGEIQVFLIEDFNL